MDFGGGVPCPPQLSKRIRKQCVLAAEAARIGICTIAVRKNAKLPELKGFLKRLVIVLKPNANTFFREFNMLTILGLPTDTVTIYARQNTENLQKRQYCLLQKYEQST